MIVCLHNAIPIFYNKRSIKPIFTQHLGVSIVDQTYFELHLNVYFGILTKLQIKFDNVLCYVPK